MGVITRALVCRSMVGIVYASVMVAEVVGVLRHTCAARIGDRHGITSCGCDLVSIQYTTG